MISLHDLLLARVRNLNEERHCETVLRLRVPFTRRAQAGQEDHSTRIGIG